jgi:hypothetical protein
MLTSEKWKRLSHPYYTEELILKDKAEDNGLTEEERRRLEYLKKVLARFLNRFLKRGTL